jgi:hypothetical protein
MVRKSPVIRVIGVVSIDICANKPVAALMNKKTKA